MVLTAQVQQDGGLVALGLFYGDGLAGHGLLESGVGLGVGHRAEGDIVQAVVGGPAAQLHEELQTLCEGGLHVGDALQAVLAHALSQLADVVGEALLGDVDGLVRAEGGADLELDGGIGGDLLMPLQSVDGVVGGADEGHVGLLNEAPDGELGVVLELVLRKVPDLLHGGGVQVALIAEELPQLQITPVIHGVADGHFQGLGKLAQPLHRRGVLGDVLLADAIGAHDPPLIVVAKVGAVRLPATQPNLHDVVEAAVLVNFLGGNVAVIVHQGHGLGVVVEQMLGGLGLQ